MKIKINDKTGKLKKGSYWKPVSIVRGIPINTKINSKNTEDKDINVNIEETDKESKIFVEINENEINVNYNVNENEKDDVKKYKKHFFKSNSWVDRIFRWADKKEETAREKGHYKKIRKGKHFYFYGEKNFLDDEIKKDNKKSDE